MYFLFRIRLLLGSCSTLSLYCNTYISILNFAGRQNQEHGGFLKKDFYICFSSSDLS